MAKFRKKPVVIDAIQWDGTEKCLDEIALPFLADGKNDFAHLPNDGRYVSPGIGYCPPLGTLDVPTLDGTLTAQPNDWIIRGVKGEFYPCKPNIFAATYEAVNNCEAQNLPGVSLRDHFAAEALPALVTEFMDSNNAWDSYDDLATSAWRIADAMLKAREQK